MRSATGLGLLTAAIALSAVARGQDPVRLIDLEGRALDPFGALGARTIVFVFVRTDCPVSNRYAPELARLHARFAPRGAEFRLVYPGAQPVGTIRRHLRDYGYPFGGWRDPDFRFVNWTGATVTPEAAVFDAQRTLRYLGRIDDRYASLARARPEPTRRDLQETLDALLDGRAVGVTRTPAVGCLLSDLR